jgi:hypothetical protein
MPVFRIAKKDPSYGIYDLTTGSFTTLTINSPTTFSGSLYQFYGAGEYTLYKFSTLTTSSAYPVISNLVTFPVPTGFSAYTTISDNSIIAKVADNYKITGSHAQLIESGTLNIEGPTEIQLDHTIFTARGKYVLFDFSKGDFSGSVSNVNISMQGGSLTPTETRTYGPYLLTTLV